MQNFLVSLSQERPLSTSEKNWESYYLLIELIHLQQHISMIGGAVILQGVPFAIDAKGEEKCCEQGEFVLRGSFGVVINDKGGDC